MARLIDEGMIAQLSKKQGYFLKYFPARIRNVGEDARKTESLSMRSRMQGMMLTSWWRRWWMAI